jgi:tetratricopeptide (TPR) repeat protein
MLIGDQAYLFDTRIGLPIPGPDGAGVATLEQAATIPLVLDRLDLPGQSPYRTTQADLAAGKITILIDSSQGYLASRMRLLQESLTAKYRMILYRDPSAMHDNFAKALGPRLAAVELWALPKSVEDRLFIDSKFVTATLYPLMFFEPKWPLLSARLDQLRGEIDSAKEKLVKFRKNPKATEADGKKPIPAEVRRALDMYATYYLGLCHLDQDRPDLAKDMFQQTLELFPEPRLNEPYYHMFRWGAQANLGRLYEAKGDDRRAIGYYSELDPTSQFHGNLYRARDLVWRDPTAPVPEPLPPPPPSVPALQQAAAK